MCAARKPGKPTKAELAAAWDRTLPDVISRDLNVLFVGINPSLYSAAVGYHFARPGNRFWPALERSGITDRLLSPGDQRQLLDFGCGCGVIGIGARTLWPNAEIEMVDCSALALSAARKTAEAAGLSADDDTLPERMLKEPAPSGAGKGRVCELDKMLPEYYSLRGWDEKGVPTAETLNRLSLN